MLGVADKNTGWLQKLYRDLGYSPTTWSTGNTDPVTTSSSTNVTTAPVTSTPVTSTTVTSTTVP